MNLPARPLILAGAIALLLSAATTAAHAQTPPPQQAWRSASGQVQVMDFAQLERLAAREVPYITELEVRDLLLKVKGHDAQGMKVELLMDRRDGQVLERKLKYPKHMRGYYGPQGAVAPSTLVPHR